MRSNSDKNGTERDSPILALNAQRHHGHRQSTVSTVDKVRISIIGHPTYLKMNVPASHQSKKTKNVPASNFFFFFFPNIKYKLY